MWAPRKHRRHECPEALPEAPSLEGTRRSQGELDHILAYWSAILGHVHPELDLRYDSSRAQPAAVGPCRAALDATVFLFEVPIGVIADVNGRCLSTIIGNHILPAGRVGDHSHHPFAGCGALRTSDWRQGRMGAVSVVSA